MKNLHSSLKNIFSDLRLKRAIKKKEFILHYQPQIDVATGYIFGFEALVRWDHPKFGVIYPSKFIPCLERLFLIDELTEIVLDSVVRDFSNIKTTKNIRVGVNFPAQYFSSIERTQSLINKALYLKQNRVSLEVEITESQSISKDAKNYLEHIRQKRIPVSIDDFGTGQTSLHMLEDVQVDSIKIDRCFISRIDTNCLHTPVLDSIILLAKKLGLALIAEGVETPFQAEHLTARGVWIHQGYLYSEPKALCNFTL